jgi:hypothetical protein
MPFYTDGAIEMMTLDSFGPRFDPQSIPSYGDWVANNSFDPFGPTSYTRDESRIGEGVGVGSRLDRGHESLEVDMTQYFFQEVSTDLPWAIANWRLMECVAEIPVRVRTETDRTYYQCKREPDPGDSRSSVLCWSIADPSPDQGHPRHGAASCWAASFPVPTRIPNQEGTHPGHSQSRAPPSDMADPLRRL